MQYRDRTGAPARAARVGGGCDRVKIVAILILAIGGDPVATALGTDSMTSAEFFAAN